MSQPARKKDETVALLETAYAATVDAAERIKRSGDAGRRARAERAADILVDLLLDTKRKRRS